MRQKNGTLFKVMIVALVGAVGAVAADWSVPRPLLASDCGNGTRLCSVIKRCSEIDLWIAKITVCNERRAYHPVDDDGVK